MEKNAKGTMQTGTAVVLCCACLGLGFAMGSLFTKGRTAPAPQQAVTQTVSQPAPSAQEGTEIARLQAKALASPKDAGAWIQLGNACYDAGNPGGAIDAYSRALALEPANADVRTDMGTMHRERGEYSQAVRCYEEALAHAPGHKNATYNKGIVMLLDLGQVREAAAFWKGVLAKDPGFALSDGRLLAEAMPQILAEAAEDLERRGNAEKALAACEEALEMNAQFLPALLRRAWLLEKGGRKAEARPVWESALKIKADALDPAGVPIRNHIAEQE